MSISNNNPVNAAHRFRSLFAVLLLALTVTMTPQNSQARATPEGFADLAAELIDAVVNISTTQNIQSDRVIPKPDLPPGSPFEDFFNKFFDEQNQPQQRKAQSLGSGFIISKDGYIVTNNHVIEDADEIFVTLQDGTRMEAKLVGADPRTDVAVLKVESDVDLDFVEFGDSKKMRIGDWVLAIGNPFNLGGTVTSGIVSAIHRAINMQGEGAIYDDYIQTDAAINRGNSGGPLFNMDGEVIGINTSIVSPNGASVGIAFAIPSNIAVKVTDQLIAYGETRRGFLGVQINMVTDDIAESLGLDEAKGALVSQIFENTPAEEAGIEPGDVIVRFDGKDIASSRELAPIVSETPVGKEVELVIIRDGKEVTKSVVLGRREELLDEAKAKPQANSSKPNVTEMSFDDLGITIDNLNQGNRELFGIGDSVEQGVVITEVRPNSVAEERQLSPGWLILQIGRDQINSVEDVKDSIDAIRAEGKPSMLLLLANKDDQRRFVAMPLDE